MLSFGQASHGPFLRTRTADCTYASRRRSGSLVWPRGGLGTGSPRINGVGAHSSRGCTYSPGGRRLWQSISTNTVSVQQRRCQPASMVSSASNAGASESQAISVVMEHGAVVCKDSCSKTVVLDALHPSVTCMSDGEDAVVMGIDSSTPTSQLDLVLGQVRSIVFWSAPCC
mmetsp:Transcript_16551/g.49364  ORF Transcript_16551/g.49364 Transcript_16551/m.49364 type:complete len:171 (+) Transcript_16551:122-634(+)